MLQVKHLALLLMNFQSFSTLDVCKSTQEENMICKFVYSFKQALKNGIPEKDFPPLDPLTINNTTLNLTNQSLNGNLFLQNLVFNGLSSFEVTEVLQDSLSSRIGIHFDHLQVSTDYDGQLNIMEIINLYGKGNLLLEVLNLNLKFQLELSEIMMANSTLKVNLPTPTVKAVFTGVFNNDHMSNIISRQFSDTATTLLSEKRTDFDGFLSEALKHLIDNFLKPLWVDAVNTNYLL